MNILSGGLIVKNNSLPIHKVGMTPLVLFISILALTMVSLCYINYNKSLTKELEKNAMDDLTNSTYLAKKSLDGKINNIYHDMHNLVTNYLENNPTTDCSDLKEYLTRFNNVNSYGELSYIPKSILQHNLKNSKVDTEYRAFLNSIFKGNDYIYAPADDTIIIQLAIPITIHENIIGCVTNSYTQENINSNFKEATFNNNGTAMVVTHFYKTLKPCIEDDFNSTKFLSAITFQPGYSYQKFSQSIENKESFMVHYNYNEDNVYAYLTYSGYTNVYIANIVPSFYLEMRSNYYIDLSNKVMMQIISCFIALFLFIIAIQIYNNNRFRKSHDILLLQQERYNTILKHSQGSIWEFNITSETLIKADPDLGIYSAQFTIPNAGHYYLEHNLIHPDDVAKFIEFYDSARNGAPEISTELRGKDISGKYIWYELIGTTIRDQKGHPITVIGQTNNINDKMMVFEELKESAKRDPLTKLYNRRCGIEMINRILSSSTRSDIHALFMIDVDNFKGINDTYGHTFGDAVLLELSTKMLKVFHNKHITARFGGDEFIAFINYVPNEDYIKSVAAKICEIFSGIVTNDSAKDKITGSIGISLYPKDGTEYDELFQKADMALYYSKNMGKNCYSFYNPELMSSMNYLPSVKDDTQEHYLHTENKTVIDSFILSNTIEILCDAKQLNISINLVINLIGNYFELDHLCIYELSEDNQFLEITFDWAADSTMKITNFITEIPIEIGRELLFYQSSSVGLFYHNDVRSLPYKDNKYTDIIKKLHTRSIFQCGIRDQGQHQAFVEAARNAQNRTWTKYELDTLTMLSKVLGSYLIKLRTEETATELTRKDLLTRSNNMFSFIEEATELVKGNPEQQYILIYTDINNFKSINENYGYSEGDRILRTFAESLSNLLTDKETYGRVNADKFIALLAFTNEATLSTRLNKLNTAMNKIPKTLSDTYKITIIMGIYQIQKDDIDLTNCIDRANIARKSIQDRHKTVYTYFDESMKSRLSKQKEIEDIMEDALKNHEFVVYYQPKFKLDTGKICGAEALVRWLRPDGSIITPNNFIPIFEDNGFIVEIDFYVLEQVCQKIRSLLDNKKRVVPISVNFSRMHLRDRMLVPKLTNVVKEYNIPPELIEVEITESALVEDNDYLLTILQDIHSNGFKLSMDDFGSGLSSLNLLRELPFDVLKLDKDFFQKGTTTPRERTIIEYIVKMALDLKMEIISEGVETQEQADFLRSINCPIAQGYLYEKPLPEDAFTKKYCND